MVGKTLSAEGVDLRWTRTDPAAPTGLFVKLRAEGATELAYYRAGSAASRLEPADIPDEALAGVDLVHLTGITTALSGTARSLVLDLARRARERDLILTFDPNYRPALWPGPEEAAVAHAELLPLVNWYLCGLEEAGRLYGATGEREVVLALRAAGVERAVVRLGTRGALVVDGPRTSKVAPPRLHAVRDEVGAGDGFAAGFAFGLLRGWEPDRCARAGHVIAATALAGTGDWETLPHLEEVASELGV